MATKNPRITITLKPEEYQVLKRLHSLNNVPMSKTVAELVSLVAPVLARMADNIEKVALADENIKQGLVGSLDARVSEMEELYSEVLHGMDMFSQELEEAVSATVAGAGNAGTATDADTATTPTSNTGVRYPNKNIN